MAQNTGFISARELLKSATSLTCSDVKNSESIEKGEQHSRRTPVKKEKSLTQSNKISNYFKCSPASNSSSLKPQANLKSTKSTNIKNKSKKRKKKDEEEDIIFVGMTSSEARVVSDCSSSCPSSKKPKSDENNSDLGRSYFSELPDLILENVFCHLPYIDLLYNATRVCTRWNNIISRPKFMEWKKEYYKFKKKYDDPPKDCKIYSVFNPSTNNDCLQHLIKCIPDYCHKPSPDMIDGLKKHKKYIWTISYFKREHPNLLLEQINPWMVVAMIVILSERTSDITQVIAILTDKKSDNVTSSILDGLYFLASAFLLIKKKFEMLSGHHYRIFYALYLYENEQFIDRSHLTLFSTQSAGQQSILKYSETGGMKLSYEQVRIVNHQLNEGQIVKIVAFAGTGKTTTLVNYVLFRPNKKFLLVVYNKSVKLHASKVFPKNVDCRTAHSLAYQSVGSRYKHKLTNKLKPFHVSKHLSSSRINLNIFKRASEVLKIIDKFSCTADREITIDLIPDVILSIGNDSERTLNNDDKNVLLEDAKSLWTKMVDQTNVAVKITHDTYLKLYQLSYPVLSNYDCIIVDEAQDCNGAMLDIIQSQTCPKILVGDPNQQIYSFRGAINSLQSVNSTHTYYLTQSFRFGSEIGYIASCCLELLKGIHSSTIVGNSCKDGTDGETVGQVAIIARTNMSVFSEAVRMFCVEGAPGKSLNFAGGYHGYGFDQLMDIYRLEQSLDDPSLKSQIKDSFISRFDSFSGLLKYAQNSDDGDLYGKISMVQKYRYNIESYLEVIKGKLSSRLENADVVFSTAHKSKGLEFDTVCIAEDYFIGNVPYLIQQCDFDEFNILYVAITRAKKRLVMSKAIYYVLIGCAERFEFPVDSATLADADQACAECPDQVDLANGGLILFKRPLQLYNSPALKSGPLCSSCAINPAIFPEVDHPQLGHPRPVYNNFHCAFEHIVSSS